VKFDAGVKFFVQFGAGLGPLVERALAADIGDFETVFGDDSGLLIEASAAEAKIAGLPYLKNAFAIIDQIPRGALPGGVEHLARRLTKNGGLRGRPRGRPFRTMFSIDGQLAGVPAVSRGRLESVIGQQTGGRVNARGGKGVEFWLIGRRDLGQLLFGERLPVPARPKPARGALASDVSALLVLAGDPRPGDVFLDPFGGSGALVAARAAWPNRRLIYSDLAAVGLPPQLAGVRGSGKVQVLAEDARRLTGVADGSVSAIVTDPPWGEHEELDVPYAEFAATLLASFDRVLDRRRGRLVLLVARRTAPVVEAAWRAGPLALSSTLPILVNGHPATVLIGGRPPP
jgi:hypothetical protein